MAGVGWGWVLVAKRRNLDGERKSTGEILPPPPFPLCSHSPAPSGGGGGGGAPERSVSWLWTPWKRFKKLNAASGHRGRRAVHLAALPNTGSQRKCLHLTGSRIYINIGKLWGLLIVPLKGRGKSGVPQEEAGWAKSPPAWPALPSPSWWGGVHLEAAGSRRRGLLCIPFAGPSAAARCPRPLSA